MPRGRGITAAILLAATLTACTKTSHHVSPQPTVPSVINTTDPTLQTVTFGGVSLDVPAAWIVNDPACGAKTGGTVIIPVGNVTGTCHTDVHDARTIVRFAREPGSTTYTHGVTPINISGHVGLTLVTHSQPEVQTTRIPALNVDYTLRYGSQTIGSRIQSSVRINDVVPAASKGMQRVSYGPISIEVPTSWAVGGSCGQPQQGAQVDPSPPHSSLACDLSSYATKPKGVLFRFVPDALIGGSTPIRAVATTPVKVGMLDALSGIFSPGLTQIIIRDLRIPSLAVTIEGVGLDDAVLRRVMATAMVTPQFSDYMQNVRYDEADGIRFIAPKLWTKLGPCFQGASGVNIPADFNQNVLCPGGTDGRITMVLLSTQEGFTPKEHVVINGHKAEIGEIPGNNQIEPETVVHFDGYSNNLAIYSNDYALVAGLLLSANIG